MARCGAFPILRRTRLLTATSLPIRSSHGQEAKVGGLFPVYLSGSEKQCSLLLIVHSFELRAMARLPHSPSFLRRKPHPLVVPPSFSFLAPSAVGFAAGGVVSAAALLWLCACFAAAARKALLASGPPALAIIIIIAIVP